MLTAPSTPAALICLPHRDSLAAKGAFFEVKSTVRTSDKVRRARSVVNRVALTHERNIDAQETARYRAVDEQCSSLSRGQDSAFAGMIPIRGLFRYVARAAMARGT